MMFCIVEKIQIKTQRGCYKNKYFWAYFIRSWLISVILYNKFKDMTADSIIYRRQFFVQPDILETDRDEKRFTYNYCQCSRLSLFFHSSVSLKSLITFSEIISTTPIKLSIPQSSLQLKTPSRYMTAWIMHIYLCSTPSLKMAEIHLSIHFVWQTTINT